MSNTNGNAHHNSKQQRFSEGTHGDSLEPATGVQAFHLLHAEDQVHLPPATNSDFGFPKFVRLIDNQLRCRLVNLAKPVSGPY
ncbi:MAG: hypothetical protein ACK4XM_12785 [Chloroherpetonaceae bacterium]